MWLVLICPATTGGIAFAVSAKTPLPAHAPACLQTRLARHCCALTHCFAEHHSQASVILDAAGSQSRYCWQCARQHPLANFQDEQRSCIASIARRHKRRSGKRKKRCATNADDADDSSKPSKEGEMAGAAEHSRMSARRMGESCSESKQANDSGGDGGSCGITSEGGSPRTASQTFPSSTLESHLGQLKDAVGEYIQQQLSEPLSLPPPTHQSYRKPLDLELELEPELELAQQTQLPHHGAPSSSLMSALPSEGIDAPLGVEDLEHLLAMQPGENGSPLIPSRWNERGCPQPHSTQPHLASPCQVILSHRFAPLCC